MVGQGRATSPFCCVRLLRGRSFDGCGCVLAKVAAAVVVLVGGVVAFYDFGCLAVALEVDYVEVAGFAAAESRFHGAACVGDLGGVFLLPVV